MPETPSSSRPLRVLFVSHSLPVLGQPDANVGGMQRVAEELYRALEAHPGVDVTLEGLRAPWKWIELLTTRFIARQLISLPSLARRKRIDVVLFSSMVTAGLAPLLRRRLLATPLVVITHGLDVTTPSSVYQSWVRRVFRAVDGILPVSEATADACIARGADAEATIVCHNGADVARFANPIEREPARTAIRNRLSIHDGSRILLGVGRQVERKGSAWFTREVLPALDRDINYVIAGSGPETTAITSAATEAGVADRTHVLGWVEDDVLKELMRGSDLFLMPNVPVEGDMEGFGVVLMEAALSELYVIGSDLEGIRDAVSVPENGVLLPARDSQAFAMAIRSALADPDELRRLGIGARTYVEETFSWQRATAHYVSVLSQIVANGPRAQV